MSKTKGIIYIIGPYRAPTPDGIDANIAKARIVAERLWREGYTVICPHLNSARMDGVVADDMFLNGYLRIIVMCDGVYVMEGWEGSVGSTAELNLAARCRLEITYEKPREDN